MPVHSTIGPVAGRERLQHLDTLRGLALLGILLVNFEYFTRPVLTLLTGADPDLGGAGRIVDWWIVVLAEGKFYALFSLLFGVGFALMHERAVAAGAGFYGLYLRRLFLLALFGLAHGMLIWAGDILLMYALIGMLMTLLFRRTPISRLPKWTIVMLAVPLVFMWFVTGLIELAGTDEAARADIDRQFQTQQVELRESIESAEVVYSSGTWTEVTAQRFRDVSVLVAQGIFWLPPILGFFLLGRWMLLSGRLRDPDAHPAFYRRLTGWALPAGLVLCLGATRLFYELPYQVPTVRLALGMTLMTAGAPLLMLGYLSLVVRFRDRLAWLAPAGRMALTNYLLQSLFWTTVFYGYGLGLWESIPRGWHPVAVIAFFGIQIVFSNWWLARFRFGPAEWLWRSLTYLRIQPMRRAGS